MTKVETVPVDGKAGVWRHCKTHRIGYFHECPHCVGKKVVVR